MIIFVFFIFWNLSSEISPAFTFLRQLIPVIPDVIFQNGIISKFLKLSHQILFSSKYEIVRSILVFLENSSAMHCDLTANQGGVEMILQLVSTFSDEDNQIFFRVISRLIEINPPLYESLLAYTNI